MTVSISKPDLNVREELAALKKQRGYAQEAFWFDGDSTTTSFALPHGWLPKFIYVDGALFREGPAEDYTVKFDGFKYAVEFAVAPAAVDVGVIAEGIV